MSLIIYLIYKVSQFLFKIFILGASGQQSFRKQHQRQQSNYRQKPKDGNVSIDYMPSNQEKKGGGSDFGGGDYVDFEEVK